MIFLIATYEFFSFALRYTNWGSSVIF